MDRQALSMIRPRLLPYVRCSWDCLNIMSVPQAVLMVLYIALILLAPAQRIKIPTCTGKHCGILATISLGYLLQRGHVCAVSSCHRTSPKPLRTFCQHQLAATITTISSTLLHIYLALRARTSGWIYLWTVIVLVRFNLHCSTATDGNRRFGRQWLLRDYLSSRQMHFPTNCLFEQALGSRPLQCSYCGGTLHLSL